MALDDPPDAALLKRAACGDRESFGELVLRHRDAVFRYARALTRREADAEDVVQQTFIAAWRGAAGAHPAGSARSWLLTIARHNVYRLGRRHVGEPREGEVESLESLGERAGFATDESPERFAERLEEREALARALGSLDEDDREVLVLRDVEGLTGVEAAGVLGVSVEAQKSRIHRARLRLAAAIRGAA